MIQDKDIDFLMKLEGRGVESLPFSDKERMAKIYSQHYEADYPDITCMECVRDLKDRLMSLLTEIKLLIKKH